MTRPVADLVKHLWLGTGTGTMTLGPVIPGFAAFPASLDGQIVSYAIDHANGLERETGIGTYTHSDTTLTRSFVTFSTGGAPNKWPFSAGDKTVRLTALGLDVVENRSTVDPGLNDDIAVGYIAGRSRWLNTSTKHLFFCVDHTAGAAAWLQIIGPPLDAGTFNPAAIDLSRGQAEYDAYLQSGITTLGLAGGATPADGGAVSVNVIGGGFALNFSSPFVGVDGLQSGIVLQTDRSYPLFLRFAPDWAQTGPGVFEDRILVGIMGIGGGGLTPTAIITSAYTAGVNELVRLDSSAGGFNVTLPADPQDGARIGFLDLHGTWATNAITVLRNGKTIGGVTDDILLDRDVRQLVLSYDGAAGDWVAEFTAVFAAAGQSAASLVLPIVLTESASFRSGARRSRQGRGDGCRRLRDLHPAAVFGVRHPALQRDQPRPPRHRRSQRGGRRRGHAEFAARIGWLRCARRRLALCSITTHSTPGSCGANSVRPKIGFGTGWGRGAFSGGAAPPATPGGDEFTTFLLDTALDGSQPWTWHWIAWNSYALDANGDVAWKAHSDGGNFDGAPTPAEMGVVLHEVTGSGTVKLYGRQNPQPTQFPSPNFPYPYIGGMITSELNDWQTYGTWECRARLKSSKGHHWAMWMLQKDGEWPPEIDIVEIVNDGTVNTLNRIFMTPHGLGEGYVPSTYHNGTTPDVWDAGGWVTLASEAAWQDWHIYKFVWSPAIMEWWIDGVLRISRPNFVNQPMYFLITPEIGNNWAGIPDGTTVWPMEAEIDYVRISSASTSPSALSATKFINAQMFHGGSIPRTITAEKFVNEQLFYSLATLAAPVTAIGDGALQSAAVEPINTGLVFCLGSHPTGSALLGTDLVSGNPGTLLTSGSLAGVNTSHGTWRCLESTSLTNGGAHFPNTSQLRSITTQRTFAFHGSIDAFGSWAALISVPYAAGTWVQPWMAHSFRRQSTTGANLNTHVATGGTGYASVNSAGGFSTGEHWFAVTVDGAAGVARFYVDGVQVGGDVGVSTATVSWGANQPVVIFNRSNSSPEEGTDGRCYTAAIWNRVLSQTELASLVIAPQRMFASGGPVTLVATKHVNAQAFGSHTLVAAGTIQLVATKFVETQVFRSHIITQSGGAVGPLEPIDGSALAVAIDVGTSPRQAWIGYGWGANGHDPAAANYPALNTHVQKLCEEMGATVIRFHTPEDVTGFQHGIPKHMEPREKSWHRRDIRLVLYL